MDALHYASDDRPEYIISLDTERDLREAGLLLHTVGSLASDIDDNEYDRRTAENARRTTEYEQAHRANLSALARRDDVTLYVANGGEILRCTHHGDPAEKSDEQRLWQEAHDLTPITWSPST